MVQHISYRSQFFLPWYFISNRHFSPNNKVLQICISCFFVFCSDFKAIKKFSSCKKIVQTLHRKIQNPVKWVKKVRCGKFAEEINNCGATSVATCKIKEKTNDRRNILHSPNQQILIHQRPPFLQNPHVLC